VLANRDGVGHPAAQMAPYNASKAALNSLTKSLSKAVALDGMLVNTVSPCIHRDAAPHQRDGGASEGARNHAAGSIEGMMTSFRPHVELKRPGRPEEVAAMVVFLASDEASIITRSNIRVDGGSVASI
jgi:3-oxoacyl-[acyl-carrier protein] reductase